MESLSLGSGAILVGSASSLIVWLLCVRITSKNLRAICALVVPFVLAYCLYWLPVWLGSDSSEYSVWEFLGIGAWFVAGFFPSAVIVIVLNKRPTESS